MWDDDRDGRREHEGLPRAVAPGGTPDGRVWNGRTWQVEDSWQDTGLVAFTVHPGEPVAVRAECQCVWHGPAHPAGADPGAAAAAAQADWREHIAAATEAAYPVDVADMMDDLYLRLGALLRTQPLGALAALRELERRGELLRTQGVGAARRRRAPWQRIADVLGVTRQSAWGKYQFAGTPEDVEAAYARTRPPGDEQST